MRHTLAPIASLLLCTAALAGPADQQLDIYWIDVEGGAATLLVTPAGETVLIDTGNPGRRDPDRIVKAVTAAGMKQIDHLIVTHYHGDHFGGALTLVDQLPVKNMYDNGQFEGLTENPGKAYFELKVEKRHVVKPGLTLPLAQADRAAKISFTFVGGAKKFVDAPAGAADNADLCASGREKERDLSDNANSVVMLVQFGPWRFYDAGDLTWNQEARLVCPKNLIGQVDVYQVTHHGLDSSNNPLVLRSLQPRVAIMNNGSTKGCLPEVASNLKETKSLEAVYQLHKNLRPDGATGNVADEYIANKEKDCQGNYVKLSVAADGKSYTVAIPANKHERKFQTRTN
ncbi:MAG TPA: MBL fold metallo-hydrolase [Pirellulaceae bacterium]|nr:MBL fold metallo-hydrolase [Pirellulaceae bacterium]